MNSEDLEKITNSIKEKIGDDLSGVIADDLGLLITNNTKVYNDLQNKDKEINNLKDRNEKLVVANGNLLGQIPMGLDNPKDDNKDKSDTKPFDFNDMFDEKGNFKRKI